MFCNSHCWQIAVELLHSRCDLNATICTKHSDFLGEGDSVAEKSWLDSVFVPFVQHALGSALASLSVEARNYFLHKPNLQKLFFNKPNLQKLCLK